MGLQNYGFAPIQTADTVTIDANKFSRDLPENSLLGISKLARLAFEGKDLSVVLERLKDRIALDPGDADALLDISTLLLIAGQNELAIHYKKLAVKLRRHFRCRFGTGMELRVLAFVTIGDFMANTPIEFLLEHTNIELILYFVDAKSDSLEDVPAHDVAFVAIGQSPENDVVLRNLTLLLKDWEGPILNNAPDRIEALSRDRLASALSRGPGILSPPTLKVGRKALEDISAGLKLATDIHAQLVFPVIVRPVGTHAGIGMVRVESYRDLSAYLSLYGDQEFYLCPYIDYQSADGLFRKQRIAFVNGKAFACHLAISDHWMVHYMSARMEEKEERRFEEAKWMLDFEGFAERHHSAFAALRRIIDLDYFVIDCAETHDGLLLVFEADVAMIVHSMDSEIFFPYKKIAMKKMTAGFANALHTCARSFDEIRSFGSP